MLAFFEYFYCFKNQNKAFLNENWSEFDTRILRYLKKMFTYSHLVAIKNEEIIYDINIDCSVKPHTLCFLTLFTNYTDTTLIQSVKIIPPVLTSTRI